MKLQPVAAGVPLSYYGLTVVKQAWQANGLDPYPGNWSFDYTCDSADFDCAEFQLTDDDPSHTYPAIEEVNSLTLSEDDPSGWTITVSCKNQNNIEIASGTDSVDLTHNLVSGGDQITCIFTNVADPTTADLTIIKETDPNGGQDFLFTLDPGPFIFELKWGSNGVAAGAFNGPFGVAVDGAGNVYVADTFAYRVQKFDADGNFILMWGKDVKSGAPTGYEVCLATDTCKSGVTGSGDGEFNLPKGIAVDGDGNVYVSDSSNDRIQKFDANGNYLDQWGDIGGLGGQFDNPNGVAVDEAGNVYVADAFNNRIQKFTADGTFLLAWGHDVVDDGTVSAGFEICTPSDICWAGIGGTGDGQLDDPFGVTVFGGRVYVADTFNHRIQVFDINGNYLDQWGNQGSGNGQFNHPYGLTADAAGNIYIADSNLFATYTNDRIQKFDSEGNYLGQWGSEGTGDGQFTSPTGVAASGASIYVTEYDGHRVQRFGQTSVVLDDDESHTFQDLAPGTYLISELVPADWDLTGIDCDKSNPTGNDNTIEVTLVAGDDVVCAFTNTYTPPPATADLTIVKSVTGTGAPADWSFSFDGSFGGFSLTDDDPNETETNLIPGDFVFGETNPAGYTTTASCDNGDSANDGNLSVTLAAGDDVECTFTNAICQPGNYDTATSWACAPADPGHFVELPGAAEQNACAPGFFQPAAGAILCIQAEEGYYAPGPAAVEQTACPVGTTSPAGSDSIDDCVSTTGTIVIVKEADPADDIGFRFTDDILGTGFILRDPSDDTETFSNVTAGSYTVAEEAAVDWNLTDISCDDDDSTGDTDTRAATINLQGGETVTCTFTNTLIPGEIVIIKDAAPDDATDFEFFLYDLVAPALVDSFTLDDDSDGTLPNEYRTFVAQGTYHVSETPVADWTLEPIECSSSTNPDRVFTPAFDPNNNGEGIVFDILNQEVITCTFTNTYDPQVPTGTIIIAKSAHPADDTSFSFTENIENVGFSLQDPSNNTKTFSDVPVGSYSVTEGAAPDWTLIDVFCSDTDSSGDTDTRTATINLEEGEIVTCTFTNVKDLPPAAAAVYMSAKTAGTTGDGVAFGSEDILRWNGDGWSVWFDGSAAGLTAAKNVHNINAFWIPNPEESEDVVIAFTQNRRTVPGIANPVDGMDLVRWNGATFSVYFDGSDVGLTNLTKEKIDGLHVLPGDASPIGTDCLSYLLISTQGPAKVPNHSGGTLNFRGEDVVGFCATSLGTTTTGLWHMVLDGSAEGMPANSTDSISLSDDGETLYLTTKGTFNVDSATGGHSSVYAYSMTTGDFSGPLFVAPAEGLPKTVDGLQVHGDLP